VEVGLFNAFLEQKLFLFICFDSSHLLLLRIKKGVVYMVAAPSLSEPGRIFTLRNIALGAAFYHEYILIPAINGISKAAETVFHFLKQPL
jgi:hypothetical protein